MGRGFLAGFFKMSEPQGLGERNRQPGFIGGRQRLLAPSERPFSSALLAFLSAAGLAMRARRPPCAGPCGGGAGSASVFSVRAPPSGRQPGRG